MVRDGPASSVLFLAILFPFVEALSAETVPFGEFWIYEIFLFLELAPLSILGLDLSDLTRDALLVLFLPYFEILEGFRVPL